MGNKKIKLISTVVSLISMLAVITIMFKFFNRFYMDSRYGVWGFEIYIDKDNGINIFIGVLGLIALLWDLSFGAYAIINGKYKRLFWQIARYGYFYGIVAGIVNFGLIFTLTLYDSFTFVPIIFLLLIASAVVLKGILIVTKEEDLEIDKNNKGLK